VREQVPDRRTRWARWVVDEEAALFERDPGETPRDDPHPVAVVDGKRTEIEVPRL